MAHFPDLSPYSFHQSGVRPGTQNIGWIDGEHPFPRGAVSEAFLKRLWQYCKVPVVQTRGFHTCDLCNMPAEVVPLVDFEGETLKLGSAEIRILGVNSVIYAAPNLVFHYVRDHGYKPPQPFIDAVLTGPAPDSTAYQSKLRALGFLTQRKL
jgi:hypothetical protein